MAKASKILLFSFLIGIVLAVTSIWWWGFWGYFLPEKVYLPPRPLLPGEIFFPPFTGCFRDGGPWPFSGTCIDNKFLNFGLDIIFWSAIVFGLWILIERGRKRK